MSSKPAFTIIEMLIVVVLFSIVMVAITGAIELFFASTLTERSKSRAISSVEFAIEEIKRELTVESGIGLQSALLEPNTERKESGYSGVRFLNQHETLIEYIVKDSDEDSDTDGYGGLYQRLCFEIEREANGEYKRDGDGFLVCKDDDKWSETLLTRESVDISVRPFFLDYETNPRDSSFISGNTRHNLRVVMNFTVRYKNGVGGYSYIPSATSESEKMQVQITRLLF